MWEQLERYKNHYLQSQLRHLKAEPISQMVKKEMKQAEQKRVFCYTPYKPECKHSTWFDDHAKLAYGWYALPKLMRELCSDHEDVQWRAINSLSEYLQNPLQAQRAINETGTIRLLKNALLRIRKKENKLFVRQTDKLLKSLILLSRYLNGSRQIVTKPYLMKELYAFILNNEVHSTNSAEILRNCSEKPEVLLYLLEQTDAFDAVTKIFHQDPCKPHLSIDLWFHLSHFLEIAPEKGIENGFFDLLLNRIKCRQPDWYGACMKCFALLLRCENGQKRFDEIDGIKMLYCMLNDKKVTEFEYVVLALQNGILSKKTMWRSREFTNFPEIITQLASSTKNERLQMYCLKVLRSMGEMPCIKNYMRVNCLEAIKSMPYLTEAIECERRELVEWLNKHIYDSDP